VWVFLAAGGCAALLAVVFWGRDRRIDLRLNQLSGDKTSERHLPFAGKRSAGARDTQQTLPRFMAPLSTDGVDQRGQIQTRLMHAGIYSPSALVILPIARALLAIAPPMAALMAAHFGGFNLRLSLMWGAIAGGFGLIAPSFWLDLRKAQRHAILNRALPDSLDLLVTCVEGGLSLEAALQRMTDELRIAHPVLAGEMGVVQKQIEFGTTPDVALRNFAERTDLESLCSLSTLLQQARRFGTPIAETLRSQAEDMRADREQRAEELAQKAAVKILFPTLLLIFPGIFVILAGPAVIQLSEAFANK
jgi:tight adherence protein C